MLEVDSISVRYGAVEALRGTSMNVDEGEIVGLVGHNGVGKSSLLQAIAGLVPLSSGSIRYQGKPLLGGAGGLARHGIAYVPEDRRLFSALTVEENIEVGATTLPSAGLQDAVATELARFPVLAEMRSRTAGLLSGGQQQMLAISRALVSRPKLLLLDEPTLGLAPIVVEGIFAALAALRGEGVTTLVVEQNVGKTVELADRTYLMASGGRIGRVGTRAAIQADEELRREYLRGSGLIGDS